MSTTNGTDRKVRYAVVGGGWISQAAFMPGVAQTGNSEITALVTGDPEKARVLGDRYGIRAWPYDAYREALASDPFDAVYLAPQRHAPRLRGAGVGGRQAPAPRKADGDQRG